MMTMEACLGRDKFNIVTSEKSQPLFYLSGCPLETKVLHFRCCVVVFAGVRSSLHYNIVYYPMMYLTLALGLLASVSAHTELSDLYKQYKAGKSSSPMEKVNYRKVRLATPEEDKYDSPFFPPHAGQVTYCTQTNLFCSMCARVPLSKLQLIAS